MNFNAEGIREGAPGATVGRELRPRRMDAASSPRRVKLGEVCRSWTSAIKQKDLVLGSGQYPIYGASGLIGYIDNYQVDSACIGVVKDGAGVGRVLRLPSHSSVIGTMMYISPITEIDNAYLYYVLDSLQLGNFCRGATIPHVYFKDFKDKTIPLPPLPVQREIAAELDRICALKKTAEKVKEKLQLLVKSRFVEMFGTVADGKFSCTTLNDICEFIKDGTHQTPTYTDDCEHGYKFLSSKDVTSGHIDWSHIKYIPRELHEELYKRIAPQKGDILLAKNGTTGIAALVDNDEIFDIYVSLALLRFKPGNDAYYLLNAINSPDTKRQFNSSLKGVGVPNLHLGEIKKTKIILPPLSLQREFAAFVAKVDKLESAARRAVEKLDLLYRSRLQAHFGE